MLLGQQLSASDFPSNFKDGHSPDDLAVKQESTFSLFHHHSGEGQDSKLRMLLRYSFPLDTGKGNISTTFLLDSGAPGPSLLLSDKTMREFTKHKILKQENGAKYVAVKGQKVYVQKTPKQQQPGNILGIQLWPLFGVVIQLEQAQKESEHPEKAVSAQMESSLPTPQPQKTQVTQQKQPAAKRSSTASGKAQTEKAGARKSSTSSGKAQSEVKTQPQPQPQTQKGTPRKEEKTEGKETSQLAKESSKTHQLPPQPKSKTAKRRRSHQKPVPVDLSKVSIEELAEQIEQPKFG